MSNTFISIWIASAFVIALAIPIKGVYKEPYCAMCLQLPGITSPSSYPASWFSPVRWIRLEANRKIEVYSGIQDDSQYGTFEPIFWSFGMNALIALVSGYAIAHILTRPRRVNKKEENSGKSVKFPPKEGF